jgi:hypothetical protein
MSAPPRDERGEELTDCTPVLFEYRAAEAENSGIKACSVDLVAAASAIHWFDLDKFYAEVRLSLGLG